MRASCVATDEISWSEQLYRIYELEPGTTITLDVIRTRVHPDQQLLLDMLVEQDGPTAIFWGRWILQVFCDDV